jgi:hypothetical protein
VKSNVTVPVGSPAIRTPEYRTVQATGIEAAFAAGAVGVDVVDRREGSAALSTGVGRWLIRYLEQHAEATIDDAAFAVAYLEAVAGPANEHAVTALWDMAAKSSRPLMAGVKRRRPSDGDVSERPGRRD